MAVSRAARVLSAIEARLPFFTGLIALLIIYWPILAEPRLWAEEGLLYIPRAASIGWPQALFMEVNGNLQFAINALSLLAVKLGPEHYALVTTGVSFLAVLVVIWQFQIIGKEQGADTLSISLAIIAFVSLPVGGEVLLSATNIQWVLGLSVVLVAFLKIETYPKRHIFALSLYVGLCCLSGLPGCIAGIAFPLRFLSVPSRQILPFIAVVGVASLTQLGFIMHAPSVGRSLSFNIAPIGYPLIIQSLITPFFGAPFANSVAAIFRQHPISFGSPASIMSIIPLLSVYAILRQDMKIRVYANLAFGVWVIVGAIQLFGAIGSPSDKQDMISALIGARYTFASQGAIILMLLSLSGYTPAHRIAQLLLTLIIIMGAPALTGQMRSLSSTLPSWREGLNVCTSRPCDVPIWPNGWTSKLQ